jgi:PA domain/Thrombospondin type 3 repeat
MTIDEPPDLAGEYLIGTASFGPPITDPISGEVALADDGLAAPGGGTPTDACEPLTNPAEIAGKIALVDRGLCGFTVKVANAQAAGAIAVLVADNVAGSPPAGLGGADESITIPSARITLDDGNAIKAALPGVFVTLDLDLERRAGADAEDHAMIYTPNPRIPGSSVSHFDTSATPNVLMEPNLNSDLGHDVDLTLPLFRDIGWLADADLDGALDGADNCPTIANAGQEDGNEDGIGDACEIRPIVQCVRRRGLINFTATFAYDNPESVAQTLAVGVPFNFFIPGINRGQPSSFAPGLQQNAFQVNGSVALIWVLGDRTAVASPFSPRCP